MFMVLMTWMMMRMTQTIDHNSMLLVMLSVFALFFLVSCFYFYDWNKLIAFVLVPFEHDFLCSILYFSIFSLCSFWVNNLACCLFLTNMLWMKFLLNHACVLKRKWLINIKCEVLERAKY